MRKKQIELTNLENRLRDLETKINNEKDPLTLSRFRGQKDLVVMAINRLKQKIKRGED